MKVKNEYWLLAGLFSLYVVASTIDSEAAETGWRLDCTPASEWRFQVWGGEKKQRAIRLETRTVVVRQCVDGELKEWEMTDTDTAIAMRVLGINQ